MGNGGVGAAFDLANSAIGFNNDIRDTINAMLKVETLWGDGRKTNWRRCRVNLANDSVLAQPMSTLFVFLSMIAFLNRPEPAVTTVFASILLP